MREIKYRAWLKDEKRMVDVKAIDFVAKQICYGDFFSAIGYQTKKFDDIEIMQYIGKEAYDINKKEVCEGDILRIPEYLRKELNVCEYVICKWYGYNFYAFNYAVGLFLETADEEEFNDNRYHEFEVVGNIYENPKMVELD